MGHKILETLVDKTVLVTGAGGSIATVLCKRLVQYPIRKLKMLNVSETAIYNLKRMFQKHNVPDSRLEFILGNVTDEELLREHLPCTDIVIHTAAHKHVPLCEENIVQAVLNNVVGTKNLIGMANRFGVEKFIFVSTDKAVKPSSVMGMTKRVGELMTLYKAGNMWASIVRFGNVKGSSGSVIPLWMEQIQAGKAITLTHKDCTRFMMSIDEACELILVALSYKDQGLYVFDMGEPVKMVDLANELMQELGIGVPIEITGLRPGEKIHEELTYGGVLDPTSHTRIKKVYEGADSMCRLSMLDTLTHAAASRNKERTLAALKEMTR